MQAVWKASAEKSHGWVGWDMQQATLQLLKRLGEYYHGSGGSLLPSWQTDLPSSPPVKLELSYHPLYHAMQSEARWPEVRHVLIRESRLMGKY